MTRVLIVDDNEEGRYLLETLLKAKGHHVTAVANGAEAIEKLKSGGFDLIISDILMPVMDGFELCRKVKTDKTLRRIPFIIYTATYTDPQDEAYALKIGADRFILKPCEPEVFLTAIGEGMAAAGRRDIASLQPLKEEKETYRLYSERLVKKLEDKLIQLERTEETLRKSEEAYRNLVETARDVIFTVFPDGTLTSLNPAFHAITGWSVDDWIGKPFSLILHPDDLPLAMEKFSRGLQGELNEVFELRVSTRPGGYGVGEFIIAPQIQNGEVVNILGIARDITERKRAEEALKESEGRLKELFDNAPVGYHEYDVNGSITRINQTA